MFIEDAKWLGRQLCNLGDEYFPMVNIGSSTSVFRTQIQPHIDEFVFKPLREQGKKVFHADIKKADGVDLTGDVNDGDFIRQIKRLQIKSVICSNLLEHVLSPQTICRNIEDMLDAGGIIFVSVPYMYPYHKDPIDTKFRPSINELCSLFPNCALLDSEIITSPDTHAKTLWKRIRQGDLLSVIMIVKRWILPLHGMDEWRKARGDMFRLFKPFQMTCVILKKYE
jgi:hypothetical protein